VKGLLLPVVPFGQASEHMQFAGTISLMAKTHLGLLSDILDSLIEHGFKKILVIQRYGGHFLYPPAFEAKKRAVDSGKRVSIYVESSNYYEIGKRIWDDLVAHRVARLRYFFEGSGGSQTSR